MHLKWLKRKTNILKINFTKLSVNLQDGAKDLPNTTYEFDKGNAKIHSVLKNGKLGYSKTKRLSSRSYQYCNLQPCPLDLSLKKTTYKYSIDGDILTLTIEQRDGRNNLNTIISAKFKKVSDATGK